RWNKAYEASSVYVSVTRAKFITRSKAKFGLVQPVDLELFGDDAILNAADTKDTNHLPIVNPTMQ
ncbi:hypothetical protein, partial [Xanthomonas fragariae]|uniref:hypothetical protein n=1 Tax=Xanthomonas fragariae TaxID=48664 RepID=UPI0025A219B6